MVLTDVNEAGREVAAEIAAATGNETLFLQQDVSDEARWAEVMVGHSKSASVGWMCWSTMPVSWLWPPRKTPRLSSFSWPTAIMSEGVFLGCQAAIKAMKKRGGGSIINMSSVASHLGYPVFFAYSAAKGAVRSMTKSLAVHCQMNGYNIRCNSIHPGAIVTPMLHNSFGQLGMEVPDPDAQTRKTR